MFLPSETHCLGLRQSRFPTSQTRPETPGTSRWNSLPLESLFGGKQRRIESVRMTSQPTTGRPQTQRALRSPCYPRAAPPALSLGIPLPALQWTSSTRSVVPSPQTKQSSKWTTISSVSPAWVSPHENVEMRNSMYNGCQHAFAFRTSPFLLQTQIGTLGSPAKAEISSTANCCTSRVVSGSKDRSPHANHGRAFFNRNRKIVAHSHRKLFHGNPG